MRFDHLNQVFLPDLVKAFNMAFSDYVMPVQMTAELLEHKIRREGIQVNKSAGAFDEQGNLTAFILNGIGFWNEKVTAYNAGTGVVPSQRGQRLTEQLYQSVLQVLAEAQVQQLLLEVIQENYRARHVYQRLGFTYTRSFLCFKGEIAHLTWKNRNYNKDVVFRETRQPDWVVYQQFWEIIPSWQNHIEAVMRTLPDQLILEACQANIVIGYAIFSPVTGNVTQLAVAPGYRRQGIGERLLQQLCRRARGSYVAFINVDATSKTMLSFLSNRRFLQTVRQFEMIQELKKAKMPASLP